MKNKDCKPTYCKEVAKKCINWHWELSIFNLFRDWDKLAKLAQGWVTCACGNQCIIIPRNYNGVPKDEELKRLGNQFSWAVTDRKRTKALVILGWIEERSQQLINEIHERDRNQKPTT